MYTVYQTTSNKDRLSVLRVLQNAQELKLILNEFSAPKAAEKLRAEFFQLFNSETGYQHLDERQRLTTAKISELLLVLEHPELPL